MFKKRAFALVAVSALLAACGSDDRNELSQESGVFLSINNSTTIRNFTINQFLADTSNQGTNFELCYRTVTNPDNSTSQVALYDNVATLDPGYCDQERLFVTGSIVFSTRFINNTLNDMPITFQGTGVSIHISREQTGEVVWSSYIDRDLASQRAGLGAFDPFETHTTVLGPAESFPPVELFAESYAFYGDSNYSDALGSADAYNLEDYFVGLGWVQGDRDHDLSDCEPVTVVDVDPANDVADKPLCQTVALEPGDYRVRVEYSFTPAQPPVEFMVTINPPST